jgi:hypothetical protein
MSRCQNLAVQLDATKLIDELLPGECRPALTRGTTSP